MKNINSYIDYLGIFKDAVETHLVKYPTWIDFLEKFEGFNQHEDTDAKINAKELYRIITDLDEFSKKYTGINLEDSYVDTSMNLCTIVFYLEKTTSPDETTDVDYWIFNIDFGKNCITKYRRQWLSYFFQF